VKQTRALIPDDAEKNSVLTLRVGTDGHGSFVGALPRPKRDDEVLVAVEMLGGNRAMNRLGSRSRRGPAARELSGDRLILRMKSAPRLSKRRSGRVRSALPAHQPCIAARSALMSGVEQTVHARIR
jgi:hypothetical protein